VTGRADAALLETYEAERGPIGRRNVAMSMTPGGGGTDDGLVEDLGAIVASAAVVPELGAPASTWHGAPATTYVPTARPGARAPHVWVEMDGVRCSTLDLVGDDLLVLVAGEGRAWMAAAEAAGVAGVTRVVGIADPAVARTYGLAAGGAVVVRPDGIVAARYATPPADPAAAVQAVVAAVTARAVARPLHRAA
jgi:hypothetical protein